MELKFQHALLAVGAFLATLGIAFAIANSVQPGAISAAEPVEALSLGLSSAFFAFFAGVLIGVGIALVANGLSFTLRGNAKHVALSLALALLSVAAAFLSVSDAKGATFFSLLVFFSGLAAAAVFALSSLVFGILWLMHAQLKHHGKPKAQDSAKAR